MSRATCSDSLDLCTVLGLYAQQRAESIQRIKVLGLGGEEDK